MHSEIIGAASVPLRCRGKPQMNDVFSEAAEATVGKKVAIATVVRRGRRAMAG